MGVWLHGFRNEFSQLCLCSASEICFFKNVASCFLLKYHITVYTWQCAPSRNIPQMTSLYRRFNRDHVTKTPVKELGSLGKPYSCDQRPSSSSTSLPTLFHLFSSSFPPPPFPSLHHYFPSHLLFLPFSPLYLSFFFKSVSSIYAGHLHDWYTRYYTIKENYPLPF